MEAKPLRPSGYAAYLEAIRFTQTVAELTIRHQTWLAMLSSGQLSCSRCISSA
jgi:hypothetical protein